MDGHSRHYQVVRRFSSLWLLVRHDGGDEGFRLSQVGFDAILGALSGMDRYWLLHAVFHAWSDGERTGREGANRRWREAAAQKRIKTRKLPSQGIVKVWIEPAGLSADPPAEVEK